MGIAESAAPGRGHASGDWGAFGSAKDWSSLEDVRARLDAGASAEATRPGDDGTGRWCAPLHEAVERGSAEVVAELAARVGDVDAVDVSGRTALWTAVCAERADVVEVLLAAGADPWRDVFGGWSAGRLALASPYLAPYVERLPGAEPLTSAERTAAFEAGRLAAVFADVVPEGAGVTFVGGLDAAEAVLRLGADPCDAPEDEFDVGPSFVGVTPVEGGCVLLQPFSFQITLPEVVRRLSADGAVAYGLFFNPKSGSQGGFARDGSYEDDSEVGLEPGENDPRDRLLLRFLYCRPDSAGELGYACAMTGVRPVDPGAATDSPLRWVRVPEWTRFSECN